MSKENSILVLFGGVSTEHEISCRSAYTIIKGLRSADYNVKSIGITKEGEWIPFNLDLELILEDNWVELAKEALAKEPLAKPEYKDLASPAAFLTYLSGGKKPDLVFLANHGINAEDGVLQGFLETCDIPYTGAKVLSSAVSMDKVFTKYVLNNSSVPQLDFFVARRFDIDNNMYQLLEDIEAKFNYPVFLKPANGGSSVGTYKSDNKEELRAHLLDSSQYDAKILIEPFYKAREIEVAVLGNKNLKAATPGEIVMTSEVEYYDYETKYIDDSSSLDIPSKISAKTIEMLQHYAKEVYTMLACEGYARVDFFVSADESEIFFNEINTLPGFTDISLFPSAWEYEAYPLEDLLTEIINLAFEAYEDNKRKINVQG